MFSPKRVSRKKASTTTPKKGSIKNDEIDQVSPASKKSPKNIHSSPSDDSQVSKDLKFQKSLSCTPSSSTSNAFTQEIYHQKVNYKTKGLTLLNEVEVKLVKMIEDKYIIPDDFELNKIKFGPLSDSYYEQRLISCYDRDKLDLKENNNENGFQEYRKLCTSCAEADHKTRYCPLRSLI